MFGLGVDLSVVNLAVMPLEDVVAEAQLLQGEVMGTPIFCLMFVCWRMMPVAVVIL